MIEEHGHHHGHHGTGVRWLDMLAAITAVFISVVSLVVSIGHGRTMERLVEQNEKMVVANTLPFLTHEGNQIDAVTNKPVARLVLKNGGVGPALIDWFEVRYKGTPYGTIDALLRACCAAAIAKAAPGAGGILYSNVSQTILPPREKVVFLDIGTDADPALKTALNEARKDMELKACYCSVLDECWLTDFSGARPKKVKECNAPKGSALW